jgi:hypothetical protein
MDRIERVLATFSEEDQAVLELVIAGMSHE